MAVEFALKNNFKEVTIAYDYQGIESWALGTWKRNNKITSEYKEYMQNKMKQINKRYKNLTNGRYTKLTNCEILEDLYRIKPYDLVKKTFVIQKRDKIQNTNFLWVQVQMCVRNRDCIKTIEEVIRNERSYVLN
mgnify:CR=1 FL=1